MKTIATYLAMFTAVTLLPAASPAAQADPAAPATEHPAQAQVSHNDGQLSADMAATLGRAGFTDLQVLPNSVFVRAKDRNGNPVAMVLDPKSMTEVVTLDPHTGSAASGNGAPLTGTGTFVTVLPTERLASALIGTNVANGAGDKIGTVRDLVVDHGGVHAYVIGVGGLFGIGDRYVAVAPGALALSADPAGKGYRATMNATLDQLKGAPEFRFEDLKQAAPK
jgi:hypothetical protein